METHQISIRAVIDQVDLSYQRNLWLTNHLGESTGVQRRLHISNCLDRLILLICNCIRFVFRKPWISIHPYDVADRLVTCFRGVNLNSFSFPLEDISRLRYQLTVLRARFRRGRSFTDHLGLNDLIVRLRALEDLRTPLPVQVENIEEELNEIEISIDRELNSRCPANIQRWELKHQVEALDVHTLLRLLVGQKSKGKVAVDMSDPRHFKELYFLGEEHPTIDEAEQRNFERAMDRFKLCARVYPIQGGIAKNHIQRMLYYLYLNHENWHKEQDPEIKKNSADAICALTQLILQKLIIANEACVDRLLIDISAIAIDLIQDFYGIDELSVPAQVATRLYAYRLDLIKKATAEVSAERDDMRDPINYEMGATKRIHLDLALPVPETCREGGHHCNYHTIAYSPPIEMIRKKFLLRYQPVAWLMKIINQHDERQLFSAMSQWYHSKVLEPLDEPDKARIIARLGTDFYTQGFERCTPALVIYFLLHQGIIHAPERGTPHRGENLRRWMGST